jgi:serine/threonine protein kinase
VEGLRYVHYKHVVHGDLRGVINFLIFNTNFPYHPYLQANVIIDASGKALLIDFGLAKFADATTPSCSSGGSLRWKAPELMDGSKIANIYAIDSYAFAFLCWEARFIPAYFEFAAES